MTCIHLKPHEVRAILGGATMLVRPVNPQPATKPFQVQGDASGNWYTENREYPRRGPMLKQVFKCPFGRVGDLVVGKEACSYTDWLPGSTGLPVDTHGRIAAYKADYHDKPFPAQWKPTWISSAAMPLWAVRLWLRIERIEVRRVQTVTEEEAKACGYNGDCPVGYIPAWQKSPCVYHMAHYVNGWRGDPWCWFVTFRREEK